MDKIKNHLSVRIDNVDIVEKIDTLLAKKDEFKSKNDIVNRALEIGVPILFSSFFGKGGRRTQEEQSVASAKDLGAIKNIVVQQAIQLNMLEYLTTILFNIEAAKAEGIEITKEFFSSGCLEQLPENLAEVKKEMTRIEYQRSKRGNDNA